MAGMRLTKGIQDREQPGSNMAVRDAVNGRAGPRRYPSEVVDFPPQLTLRQTQEAFPSGKAFLTSERGGSVSRRRPRLLRASIADSGSDRSRNAPGERANGSAAR